MYNTCDQDCADWTFSCIHFFGCVSLYKWTKLYSRDFKPYALWDFTLKSKHLTNLICWYHNSVNQIDGSSGEWQGRDLCGRVFVVSDNQDPVRISSKGSDVDFDPRKCSHDVAEAVVAGSLWKSRVAVGKALQGHPVRNSGSIVEADLNHPFVGWKMS